MEPTSSEWAENQLNAKQYIAPQTWSFTSDGQITAYEFISTDCDLDSPSQEFIQDLFIALKEGGVIENVGLRRLDGDRDGEAFEVTPEGKRCSITTMGTMPHDVDPNEMTKVLWYFTHEGVLQETGDCNRCGICVFCG